MPTSAPKRSWVEQIMGLPISVLGRGEGATSLEADAAVRTVFAELVGVDLLFSPYRADSAVSRLNRGETSRDECPDEVRDVMDRCAWASRLTAGLFDAGRAADGWDPSGLVKGWATERALRHLVGVGATDWCLNAGGDVVVSAPSGAPFVVGIEDPRDRTRVAMALPLVDGAVATSGSAARGAHVYDPRTGRPVATSWLSVSVVGASLETADVLATAAFVAGDDWVETIRAVEGYEGLAVPAVGQASRTSGWPMLD